jgi:hypothetical protein
MVDQADPAKFLINPKNILTHLYLSESDYPVLQAEYLL